MFVAIATPEYSIFQFSLSAAFDKKNHRYGLLIKRLIDHRLVERAQGLLAAGALVDAVHARVRRRQRDHYRRDRVMIHRVTVFGSVIVFGAGGMLGRQMALELRQRGIAARLWARADLDIGDLDALRTRLAEARPSLILNCAAFTKVDDCETDPCFAMRVNGEAVGVMAEAARISDALLIHISSDYVFRGDAVRPYREEDPTGPPESLGAYGRSKLDGERRILAAGCRHLLIRTSWVFGPGGANFVDTIRKAAATRPELRVVTDQRGRPTYSADLAGGTFTLIDRDAEGIVHVANADECTWHEFACEIIRRCGLATPVHPYTSAEFPRPAKRPAYSVLDTARCDSLTGRPLRSWRDALVAYLGTAPP